MKLLASLGIALCLLGLAVSVALVLPDPETQRLSGVAALLGHPLSSIEILVSIALVSAPWLLLMHLLSRYKQRLHGARGEADHSP